MRDKKLVRQTLTVTELAQVLGISRSSAYDAVHNGDIKAMRLGRRIVVSRLEVNKILGADPDAELCIETV